MNITEANILALVIQAKALEVEVIAMRANDTSEGDKGLGCFPKEAYFEKSQALYAISDEIQQLARLGYL
jgi:hypothetical protein